MCAHDKNTNPDSCQLCRAERGSSSAYKPTREKEEARHQPGGRNPWGRKGKPKGEDGK